MRRLLLVVALCVPILTGLPTAVDRSVSAASVTFKYDSGVCSEDKVLIERGIRIAQAYFKANFGGDVSYPVTVTVTSTNPGSSPPAEANSGGITVRTAHPVWSQAAAKFRIKITIHEYFHKRQSDLMHTVNSPPLGATWLNEGSAEYVAFQAAINEGLFSEQDVVTYHELGVSHSSPSLPPLQNLEAPSAFYSTSGSTYSLAYLATDQALGSRSISTLRTYFAALGNGTYWKTAFQSAFGKSTSTFYSSFATYRSNMKPDNLPQDFWGTPPPCTKTTPRITLSPTSGTVNHTVTATLSGYPKNHQVKITWDGVTQTTVTTSSTGAASASFKIPADTKGGHTVRGSGAILSASATFKVVPRIKLIPNTVERGQTVNVSLRGFVKKETVRIRWKKDGTWVELARVLTSNTGSANINITVPAWAPDGQTSVRGDSTNTATGGRAQTNVVFVDGGPFDAGQQNTSTPSPTSSPAATPTSTWAPMAPSPTETPLPTETLDSTATPEPVPTEPGSPVPAIAA